MKTSIIILTVLVSAAVAALTLPSSIPTKEYILFGDITDTHQLKPETDQIRASFELDDNLWSGIAFTWVEITDLKLNLEKQIVLPKKNQLLGNQLTRKKEVDAFLTKYDTIANRIQAREGTKDHSAVYLPLAKQLNQLSKSTANDRRVFVYSDLMENADISFYNTATFKALIHSPDSIATSLEEQLQLSDLQGITVHFMYRPKNREEDQQFAVVSTFFQDMLEAHNANVVIQASLTINTMNR